MENKSIIISDLRCALPSDAISDKYEKGKWFSVPYAAKNGIEGYLLFGDDEYVTPPQIEIPLNANGVYKIFLGLNYTHARNCRLSDDGEIWVKLTGDSGFDHIAREIVKGVNATSSRTIHCTIFDTYYTTADVTGRNLHVSTPTGMLKGGVAGLCYVRLEPLNEQELEAYEKLKPSPETRRGIALWCGGDVAGNTRGNARYYPMSKEWVENELHAYMHNDIGVFSAEIIRGNQCMFKTDTGDMGNVPDGAIDLLAEMTAVCKRHGVKMWAGARFIGAAYPIVKEDAESNFAKFYWENQELSTVDREGGRSNISSIAFPEVQEHWLKIYEDALKYGIDGLCIYLHRCYPFVCYEKPVRESFINKYGIDPITLPDNDERWLRHTAQYITEFLRKVRKLTNKYNAQLAVCVRSAITGDAPPDEPVKKNAKTYYLDVDTFVKENLVDVIIAQTRAYEHQVKRWKSLGSVKVISELQPRSMPGDEAVAKMRKYYDMGVDGYSLWDANRRPNRISEWNVVKWLGHRDMFDYLEKMAPTQISGMLLKRLNNISIEISYFDG